MGRGSKNSADPPNGPVGISLMSAEIQRRSVAEFEEDFKALWFQRLNHVLPIPALAGGAFVVIGALGAMGVPPEIAAGALRLSLGRGTEEADVIAASDALISGWRALSTLN